ncbi:hypothetical protein H4582DRAFT_1000785 [Lactarius indigo]|nr:hypothetical protein H4582DRAFT_1000785 [Lactarius indigo]
MPAGPVRNSFMRNWWAVEAIPMRCRCLVVRGISPALRVARISSGPSLTPTPWNDVKQDENVKMMSVNQKFEKSWSRDKL